MTRFWWHIGLVGLAAGLCSALLVVTVASGVPLALLLCCLAPLPIAIVSIGWSHWAGLVAVATASILLALAIHPAFLIGIPLSFGLLAWWLAYLALLARPSAREGELDWYPIGRLVLWAALLSALIASIGLLDDMAAIQRAVREGFERMLRLRLNIPDGAPLTIPGVDDPKRAIDVLMAALPSAAAVLFMIVQLFNLWLAAQVVNISGRLRRPSFDLAAMRLPAVTMLILVLAFAGTFLPGILGIAATLPTASLLFAYVIMGFAAMHGITRFMHGRPIVLAILYAGFVLLGWSGWPTLLMALLGMIDGAFDLRRRVAAAHGPPPIPPA